jgi:primosomal replication protein N
MALTSGVKGEQLSSWQQTLRGGVKFDVAGVEVVREERTKICNFRKHHLACGHS